MIKNIDTKDIDINEIVIEENEIERDAGFEEWCELYEPKVDLDEMFEEYTRLHPEEALSLRGDD